MRLGWSWHWEPRGPVGAWFAGTVFLFVGLTFWFAVPAWLLNDGPRAQAVELREAALVLRLLGVMVTALGAFVLLLMAYGVRVRRKNAGNLVSWHRWVGFVGGIAGAALFAIPATMALPFMVLIGRREAAVLFPELGRSSEDLWVGGLFSVIGLLVLAALVVLARVRPSRGHRDGFSTLQTSMIPDRQSPRIPR